MRWPSPWFREFCTADELQQLLGIDAGTVQHLTARNILQPEVGGDRFVTQASLIGYMEHLRSQVRTMAEIEEVWREFSQQLNAAVVAVPRAARVALPHLTDADENALWSIVQTALVAIQNSADEQIGLSTDEFGVLAS